MNGVLVCSVVCLFICSTVMARIGRTNFNRNNSTMWDRSGNFTQNLSFHYNPSAQGSSMWERAQDVCYPTVDRYTLKTFSISAFNVTDVTPWKGGKATVTRGGIGSDRLCLKLKSKHGNGYNFTVNISGNYV